MSIINEDPAFAHIPSPMEQKKIQRQKNYEEKKLKREAACLKNLNKLIKLHIQKEKAEAADKIETIQNEEKETEKPIQKIGKKVKSFFQKLGDVVLKVVPIIATALAPVFATFLSNKLQQSKTAS